MQQLQVSDSMAKNSFAALLLLFVPLAASAQTFTNEVYGYSIEVGDNFQLTGNNHATSFSSDDDDSVVIIKNWPGLDDDTARNYLQEGYQDERIAVVAVNEPEEINVDNGTGLQVEIQAIVDRKLMQGMAAAYIGNDGQGMVVKVSASSDNWDKLAPVAQSIISSVKFVEYSAGPSALDWYYMLAGTRLSLRGSSNDTRRREDIYFCSDGSFRHRMSSSASRELDSGSTFGFSTKTRSGSWKVMDDAGKSRLILRYTNGREKSAVIEDRNGQTFLDNQRFYMMRNDRCR
jgi:hypothetical protein